MKDNIFKCHVVVTCAGEGGYIVTPLSREYDQRLGRLGWGTAVCRTLFLGGGDKHEVPAAWFYKDMRDDLCTRVRTR